LLKESGLHLIKTIKKNKTMKKKYILYLFITFITSIIIITTIENTSKYVTFKEAKKK